LLAVSLTAVILGVHSTTLMLMSAKYTCHSEMAQAVNLQKTITQIFPQYIQASSIRLMLCSGFVRVLKILESQDWKVLEKCYWSWKVLEFCVTQAKNMKCMADSKEN